MQCSQDVPTSVFEYLCMTLILTLTNKLIFQTLSSFCKSETLKKISLCKFFFSTRAMHDDTAIQIKNMHVYYTLVKYFFHTKLSPISLSSSSPSPPVNFFIAWSTHCVPASGPLSMCKKLFPRATYKNHITHKCKVHRESANWKTYH